MDSKNPFPTFRTYTILPMSDAQKMSGVLSSYTIPPFVLPFVKRGSASNLSDVTLCLWDYESNVSSHSIHRLASYWKDTQSSSTRKRGIYTRIYLSTSFNATRQQLDSFSPNLFLNLARLLAPTSYAMLFPGDISLVSSDLRMMTQVLSDTKASQSISVVCSWYQSSNISSLSVVPRLDPSRSSSLVHRAVYIFKFPQSNWDECFVAIVVR
ncbi:hypothetical protein BT96DRAFT_9597 [Gymnopus androsaceus JB14]|uniref:Uncharacterized protein n=1 Tax=Gymnopus androsaceus JB14 TaxID=1447944 RepID=A0A6A4IG87_9AGAR|nr:hypothetical protein BT96DRAFT_9597 [Gymnopus androsaceus JB14]